jgi:perosamine synthetase
MGNQMISLYKVHMPAGVEQKLKPILESGYIAEGPVAKEFELAIQTWMKNPYVSLCNSGTSALTLALRLANVGIGDEVITSPMTCLATNEPILIAGAIPVFCDIDPATGNIDASKIEELITPKTKAILFVDWAGTPCELSEICSIAKRYRIKTIEDAAHSLGAVYKGQCVGSICDYTCFSFQAIKHLTTVDGGAIAMLTPEDYERCILLRWFGCKRAHNKNPIKWEGDVIEPGYKMHMNDVNAAIGLAQMPFINANIARHRLNGNVLQQELSGVVETTLVPDYITSSYWMFTIKLDDLDHRARVSQGLTDAGIGNSITHTRNDSYSLFKPYARSLPGLDNFGSRMLNIPCGWWVTDTDREYIINTLKRVL